MCVIVFHQPGKTKIRETRFQVFSQQYVCGADIAMYNARLATMMQICQCPCSPQSYFNSCCPIYRILFLVPRSCCRSDQFSQKSAYKDMICIAVISLFNECTELAGRCYLCRRRNIWKWLTVQELIHGAVGDEIIKQEPSSGCNAISSELHQVAMLELP